MNQQFRPTRVEKDRAVLDELQALPDAEAAQLGRLWVRAAILAIEESIAKHTRQEGNG